jgi:hypothetical protein
VGQSTLASASLAAVATTTRLHDLSLLRTWDTRAVTAVSVDDLFD